MKKLFGLISIFLFLFGITGTAQAVVLYAEDFNDGVADGWVVASGTWQVISNQYHQTNDADTGGPARISVYTWETFDDFYYQVDISTDTSTYDGGYNLGLAYRYTDLNNYYIAYYHPGTSVGAFRTEKVVNGVKTRIVDNYTFGAAPRTASTFAVSAEGNQFTAYFNGEEITSWSDDSLSSGQIGLYAWDAKAAYDNLELSGEGAVIPEPVSIFLFGSGLAGLAGFNLRRKRRVERER